MPEHITKRKVATSFIWNLSEKIASQGLQFVISIILARLLLPDDYGVVALLTVFIQIANVFVIDGFNSSLIQKNDSDDLDFSSVFWFTCLISIILYLLLFFTAPLIASFYKQPILKPLTRLLAISFFYTPLASCQYAFIEKHLLFKVYLLRSIICMVLSGTTSIVMAFKGFGVYSLVVQQLVYGITNSLILWFSIEWKPKFIFSITRIKFLFSFGWKLVCSGLLGNIFRNIYSLIIGKAYNAEQLGYYNRGQQFPGIIANNFTPALKNVIFPAFSTKNDDISAVKNMLRRSVSINAYVLMPLLFGLAAIARPLTLLLLTEKWEPSIPFLQMLCLYFIFYYVNEPNMTAINSLGKSGVFLKYEVIKKTITILALFITIPFGIYAITIGQIAVTLISSLLNFIPSKHFLNYSYREQITDILPSFVLSAFMGSVVYIASFISIALLPKLLLQIFIGVSVYLLCSFIFKLSSFTYLVNILKAKK